MSIFNKDLKRPSTIQEQIFEIYAALKELEKMQIVPRFMDAWNEITNYNAQYMVVSYNGSSYIRAENGDCINLAPDINVDQWQILAERGQEGNSVTGVTAGQSTINGENTVTPLTFTYSEREPQTVNISAKNGTSGVVVNGVECDFDSESRLATVTGIVSTIPGEKILAATVYIPDDENDSYYSIKMSPTLFYKNGQWNTNQWFGLNADAAQTGNGMGVRIYDYYNDGIVTLQLSKNISRPFIYFEIVHLP